MHARRFVLKAAALLALSHYRARAAAANAPADDLLTVPLHVRIAHCPPHQRAVHPEAWVHEHVAAAREVLKPHRIQLTMTLDSIYPKRCALADRADRNALATQAKTAGAVPVVVVQSVRDLDVPDYSLMGVHWRYAGSRASLVGRRWIFLTARAQPPVLAHELCHFFALAHDPTGGNLMTPGPSSPAWRSATPPRSFAPVLTPAQGELLRANIRSWLQAN